MGMRKPVGALNEKGRYNSVLHLPERVAGLRIELRTSGL